MPTTIVGFTSRLLIKKYLSGFRHVLSLLFVAMIRDWRYCSDAADINRGQHPATQSQWTGLREQLYRTWFFVMDLIFGRTKYRGKQGTFSHQPVQGLLFSWNFVYNIGEYWWLGNLQYLFICFLHCLATKWPISAARISAFSSSLAASVFWLGLRSSHWRGWASSTQ